MTDDQGYGDLSCHGNPILKTPNLDKLHGESIRFTDFHVSPVCTPTRAQIMSGYDALKTGAYVPCSGRDLLRQGMPTMANVFAAHLFSDVGYRTGLFGKWHLGNNYPYRPQDRGFQESVWFRGWGITSAQNYWNNSYYDDRYIHNGKLQHYQGYCTDVWFQEAMRWMQSCAARKEPFFVYLPDEWHRHPKGNQTAANAGSEKDPSPKRGLRRQYPTQEPSQRKLKGYFVARHRKGIRLLQHRFVISRCKTRF